MEISQILMYVLQTVTMIVVGVVGYFLKDTMAELRNSIKKNADDVDKLKNEFNELKADLPFVYVLREDYIRTLNNVDRQMGDMNNKLDKIISASSKG